jgi:hypothetical protein
LRRTGPLERSAPELELEATKLDYVKDENREAEIASHEESLERGKRLRAVVGAALEEIRREEGTDAMPETLIPEKNDVMAMIEAARADIAACLALLPHLQGPDGGSPLRLVQEDERTLRAS